MWRYEKETGDIVVEGFDKGIFPSPHKGIANIQAGNISTENEEVLCSFARALQSQPGDTSTNHTATRLDSSHLSTSFTLTNGVWITVSNGGTTGISPGTYYIQNSNGTSTVAATSFQISSYYNGTLSSGFSAGTITFTLLRIMGQPVDYAIEKYNNAAATSVQYRYYVLDINGLVWVQDTNVGSYWFLPDSSNSYWSGSAPSGIAILNGWLHVFAGNVVWVKPTINLGGTTSTSTTWVAYTNLTLMSLSQSPNPHTAFVGHQGKLYYCDGTYLGSIFPDTSLLSGVANVQSYAAYTTSTTTGTISVLIGGSIPSTGNNVGTTGYSRIPAVFFTDQAGTMPAALSANVVYWIAFSTANSNFQVFAAQTGGSAIDITTSAVGNQYFNTYFPVGTHAGAFGDTSTVTVTPQRLNLPYFEVATCMTEVGNNVIVGGIGDILYPWNQIDALPTSFIFLPERNTVKLITVNQMAYAFAGNKGSVYITDGSVASLVIKVPDYCAGIAGTESSYIEPYFSWGGAAYIRGRVYFSILDQTATKTGNCGGIWSFVPTQNLYIGQDTGLALRLENQNSYGTYNGVAPIIIPRQTQNAISPQYWAAWYSSISSPTYGIDFTSTTPSTAALVETDLIPTGTFLDKRTFAQIEYKLAAPLEAGETVTMKYRLNGTDTYQTCGSVNTESSTGLSGYFGPLPFQNTQWLQLQATLNPNTDTTSSFVRLKQIRIR